MVMSTKWAAWPVVLAFVLLAGGCGGSSAPAPGGDNPRSPWTFRTPAERDALRARFANAVPARVFAALRTVRAPQRSAAFTRAAAGGKGTSETLPYTLLGEQQYEPGINESGWFSAANAQPGQFGGMDLQPAGPDLPESFAYAIYKVSDITAELKSLTVNAFGGPYGVAAYDFAGGGKGWELLYFGTGAKPTIDLTQPAGADWTNAGDDLGVMVFSLNPDTATIFDLTFSNDDAPPTSPPTAFLESAPFVGDAPLEVTLDATLSTDDDGVILTYAFDPEGDGTFLPPAAEPTMQYTYADGGVYKPLVEVTDNDGLKDTHETTVVVGGDGNYDEVENNDSIAEANPLPAVPFQNWYGNIGFNGAYDSDVRDFLTFDAATGDVLLFEVNFSNPELEAYLELYDANDRYLMGGTNFPYEFTALDQGPYSLVVFSNHPFHHSDYFLSMRPTAIFDEWEDNDTVDMANYISFEAQGLSDWTGSLGTGGSNYDGDDNDWLWLDGSIKPGDTVDLTLEYTQATGNVDISLLDSEGDVIAASADTDGSEAINYVLSDGDVAPIYLHIEMVGGYADYSVSGTHQVGQNPNYDEIENNDWSDTANSLPDLPFADFAGNVGFGGVYNGDEDWFSFPLGAGENRNFVLSFDDSAAAPVRLSIWRSVDGPEGPYIEPVKSVAGTVSPLTLSYTPRSIDSGPYYLVVSSMESWETPANIDYTLSGNADGQLYDEVEDNDEAGEANPLSLVDETPTSQIVSSFTGNLGLGGAEIDGDVEDWTTFSDLPVGWFGDFYIYYDSLTAVVTAQILDGNGNVIASSSPENGYAFVTIYNDEAAPLTGPFYLKVNGAPFTDYWIQGTTYIPFIID
jgi:hypothetical protein